MHKFDYNPNLSAPKQAWRIQLQRRSESKIIMLYFTVRRTPEGGYAVFDKELEINGFPAELSEIDIPSDSVLLEKADQQLRRRLVTYEGQIKKFLDYEGRKNA